MNKVILIGRTTKEIELKFTPKGNQVVQFSLAVDRKYKDQDGNKITDFFNCVAWRKLAEFLANNVAKGQKVMVSGELQTRKYQAQDGTTKYITEILVSEFEFCEGRKGTPAAVSENDVEAGFVPLEGDDDVPF